MSVVTKEGKKGELESGRLPFLARLRVDRDLPSLNKLLRSTYARNTTVGKITATWKKLFWGLQMEQLGPEWAAKLEVVRKHPQRRLEIIRRCKKKLDRENAWGGVKPIVDALKSKNERVGGKLVGRAPGWFYDDTETYLDLHVAQLTTGEEPWLEIVLYGHLEKQE